MMCVAALVALAAQGCGGDDGTSSVMSEAAVAPTTSAPAPPSSPSTAGGGSAPAIASDATVYCERADVLSGERPEAYVGSAQQRADIDGLIAVAPTMVLEPLATFAQFLASGAIDPADPDTNLTENWPAPVQTAIEKITEFTATNC